MEDGKITKDDIMYSLIYDDPVTYQYIKFYPLCMDNYFELHMFSLSIMVRKDSLFYDKKILKMSYYEFLKYCHDNFDLSKKYKIDYLPYIYSYFLSLMSLTCKDSKITYNTQTLDIYVDDYLITDDMFDNIRRIIIFQNDLNFDIDEFIHSDTLKMMDRVDKKDNDLGDKIGLEDLIDSLSVQLGVSNNEIKSKTIRRFNRLIKRTDMYDEWKIMMKAQMSGMVTLKNPIKDWRRSIEIEDKFAKYKADENKIKEIG